MYCSSIGFTGVFTTLICIQSIDCNDIKYEKTKDSKESIQNAFLRPKVILTRNSNFDLNLDGRYPFHPGFAEAPFSTVGKPWPLPKYYKTEKDALLQLNKSTFKIAVLNNNNPCDILTKAIKRYKNIIENHITEEHYDFPFNFNEKTFIDHQKEMEKKYATVTIMSDLEIVMTSSSCEYPHINMDESYRIELRPNIAKLTAEEVWGALRGLETFSQLLFRKQGTDQVYAKVSEINDGPRFPHRGIMIDTARHYIYKNTIKDVLNWFMRNSIVELSGFHDPKGPENITTLNPSTGRLFHTGHSFRRSGGSNAAAVEDSSQKRWINMAVSPSLDGMSYNKLNVLHWHIVDDNSFPYKSEVFPKLSEKAAFHPSLVYTLKDLEEIVEYARYRGIRVIPEFDTPGHSFSWFGYPEIMSTCYKGTDFVGPLGPINPAQNQTYTFIAKLFSEIYNVFPDTFVHLGGDELSSTCWTTNPEITSYLQTNAGIPATEAKHNPTSYISKVVGYYFNRLIPTLQETARKKKHKKAFIMWEDVLKKTDVPKDSILQLWTGGKDTVRSMNERGYRAIYSSCWYLNEYTPKTSWFDYYTCEPSPYKSEDEEKDRLLGGEACLWAEYVTTDSLMTIMWPRASVPAERLWSPKRTTGMTSASTRLQEQRCRMVYRGLATGHISGPDYCLRHKHRRLSRSSDVLQEEEVDWIRSERKKGLVEERCELPSTGCNYSHFYGYFVVLWLAGVFLFIAGTRTCRYKVGTIFRIR